MLIIAILQVMAFFCSTPAARTPNLVVVSTSIRVFVVVVMIVLAPIVSPMVPSIVSPLVSPIGPIIISNADRLKTEDRGLGDKEEARWRRDREHDSRCRTSSYSRYS